MTRRKARVLLAGVAVMVISATAIVIAGSLSLLPLIAAEALLFAGMMLLDRLAVPVERWGPGAGGEEHVGRLLKDLEAAGWLTLHDVDTGASTWATPRSATTAAATADSPWTRARDPSSRSSSGAARKAPP